MARATKTFELLETLHRHKVEYIVVGMTAAVLQGAPGITFDLDVVYRRTPENIDRLQAALVELESLFRGDPRRLAPNRSHLESTGHKLLETKYGDFDVLSEIDEHASYDTLLPDTDSLSLHDFDVRVLRLERLIEIKERAGREKDLAVLPLLRATLARGK